MINLFARICVKATLSASLHGGARVTFLVGDLQRAELSTTAIPQVIGLIIVGLTRQGLWAWAAWTSFVDRIICGLCVFLLVKLLTTARAFPPPPEGPG